MVNISEVKEGGFSDMTDVWLEREGGLCVIAITVKSESLMVNDLSTG